MAHCLQNILKIINYKKQKQNKQKTMQKKTTKKKTTQNKMRSNYRKGSVFENVVFLLPEFRPQNAFMLQLLLYSPTCDQSDMIGNSSPCTPSTVVCFWGRFSFDTTEYLRYILIDSPRLALEAPILFG